MFTYDPSEARMRVALHDVGQEDQFDHGAAWQDHRLTGEELGLQTTLIESASLSPGGQRTPGSQGKIRTGPGNVNVELEPDGLAPYLALFQRQAKTPVELTPGAWRHWLAPNAGDVDFRDRRLLIQTYRDDAAVQNSYGAGMGGFDFNTQVDSKWSGSLNVVATRADYWGAPTQTAGGAATVPRLRGLPRLDLKEDADVLKVQVVNTGLVEGDFEIVVYIDDTSPGATGVVITAGEWSQLVLSGDGSGVGAAPSHVDIHWADDTVAVGDTWEIPIRAESPWVSSLPPVRALSEVETELWINGVLMRRSVSSLGVSASQTAEPDVGIGGVWPGGVLVSGQRTITWNLDRLMVDNFFQHRLEATEPLHLDVIIKSPVHIGATTVPYQVRFVSPHCLLDGTRPTITDANTQQESYQLNAYPAPVADAFGFVDDLTVVLDNGVASYALS